MQTNFNANDNFNVKEPNWGSNACVCFRNAIDVNLREHEGFAKQLLDTLVQLIDQKANETDDFLGRLQLQDYAQKFQVCLNRLTKLRVSF